MRPPFFSFNFLFIFFLCPVPLKVYLLTDRKENSECLNALFLPVQCHSYGCKKWSDLGYQNNEKWREIRSQNKILWAILIIFCPYKCFHWIPKASGPFSVQRLIDWFKIIPTMTLETSLLSFCWFKMPVLKWLIHSDVSALYCRVDEKRR